MARLTANGTRDNSFVAALTENLVPRILPLPTGQLLVGSVRLNGQFGSLARLTATGALDPTFTTGLASYGLSEMRQLANGRILVAGSTIGTSGNSGGPLALLNANGGFNTSFNSAGVFSPADAFISSLVVQPDGAFLVAGQFTHVGGVARAGLARLTAPGVLAVGRQQSSARTEVWPNPVHDKLTLSLDLAAQPRQLTLIDALGKTVLRQPAATGIVTVPLLHLPAGVYVLRVEYADGPVTRRVVVE
ncbi:putative secreted protein (Por secretion system target) [Hymenobacter chitinivorans DSM 11115]|uniref:Putative secreted protein (Por secretion system target) n=1 Tax=Hymenobacter chitinivorans DSM 11115 TaxID=1121954 RepID=A0A2M9B5G1_9BACT|nr:putative secreted protein (Por secretion system target) [Hymenobacter chitinivorans DSM 11115]